MYAYHLADPGNKGRLDTTLFYLHRPSCFQASLPLARRLQFGQRQENTYLITSIPEDARPGSSSDLDLQEPWLCAFVDRACRPETEVWLFGSWEAHSSSPTHEASPTESTITALIASLIGKINSLPLAPSIHGEEAVESVPANTMLWGAIHERTIPYLRHLKILPAGFSRELNCNSMFIFRVTELPEPNPLPPGLHWGTLSAVHLPLVRSRTSIPRQDRTLGILRCLAIYGESAGGKEPVPVAWVFVGLDSSLTTLHVEASHRRLGLAKALTVKLFREEMSGVYEDHVPDDARLAFGYVQEGNDASSSMCRSLGGRSKWEVYWIRMNVEKV